MHLVIVVTVLIFGTTVTGREGILAVAGSVTLQELAQIHLLRLASLGVMFKVFQKQLPLHFLICGALPDFLFAMSAVYFSINGNAINTTTSLTWHVLGVCVFLGAGVSMYLSVPSPLRIWRSKPDTELVFQFPMVLAPNFTVPLFMFAHVLAIIKLNGLVLSLQWSTAVLGFDLFSMAAMAVVIPTIA